MIFSIYFPLCEFFLFFDGMHLLYTLNSIFLLKMKSKDFKIFLCSLTSWAIMSLSILFLLHNEINSRLKKLLSFFINYWHKIPASVNFSWYFFKLDVSRSVGLSRLSEWKQHFFWMDMYTLKVIICSTKLLLWSNLEKCSVFTSAKSQRARGV